MLVSRLLFRLSLRLLNLQFWYELLKRFKNETELPGFLEEAEENVPVECFYFRLKATKFRNANQDGFDFRQIPVIAARVTA